MDKNTIVGLTLIAVIVVVFSLLNRPSQEEIEAAQRQRDSISQAQREQVEQQQRNNEPVVADIPLDTAAIEPDSIARLIQQQELRDRLGVFADAAAGERNEFLIENELLKVTLTNMGGNISSVELKNYRTYDSLPLILYNGENSEFGFNFFAQNRTVATKDLYFNAESSSFSVSGEDIKSFTMRLPIDAGRYVDYVYSLHGNSYEISFTVNMVGLAGIISSNTNSINLNWNTKATQFERDLELERTNSTLYYKHLDDDVDYLSETDDDNVSIKTKLKWVAFKQQFFSSVLIAENGFDKPSDLLISIPATGEHLKTMQAQLMLPFEHKAIQQYDLRFYFGPNHYQTLKKMDLELEAIIPLGWGIFGWVNKFLVIPIFNFLNSFDLNFGIIILILTLIIKILLLPLTYKAYLSTAKMRVLKPEIDEINKKHKEEPLKMQQEMMSLYRKAGVNPLGGCLPMVLQLPILIAMFRFFPASIELRQEPFLWAHDLSTYDSILDLPFSIPFYGAHVSLFTLLMTISTLIYTKLNSQMTGQTNQQMKIMMYLMPVVFLGVFNNFPAGLSYYYFLSNVISIGQQYLIRGFVDEDAIHRKIQEQKKKPVKKSKFQARLEDMAKQRGYTPPKKK
ncbi:MAG: membrane protein insertase YidC [Bacteroidia bacterium]